MHPSPATAAPAARLGMAPMPSAIPSTGRLLRGTDPRTPDAADGSPALDGERLRARPRRIVCKRCGHWLTTADARIEVGGSSEHIRENPHGLVFHIRCFARAPGAAAIGAPTTEHTWFAGYGWQVALCGGCRRHVGWAFTGGAARFWGLIADRLAEAPPDAG